MKKKFLISVFIIFLIITLILTGMINREKYILKNKEHRTIMTDNTLAMMYETSIDSGEYTNSKDSIWPLNGYIFNATLSKCENGSEISWDDTNKKVIVSGISSDKCYVYFDKAPVTLAKHIQDLYTIQGENNLYYHNGNYTGDNNDLSYRYAGSDSTTNNWLCFGSNEVMCLTNNLYRIIGVFDDYIKVIKNDSIGSYVWSSSASDNWQNSSIRKLLNEDFLNTFDTNWQSKIALGSWYFGEVGYPSGGYASDYYKIERNTNSSVDQAKIGLIYPSDFGYANSSFVVNLNSYGNDGSNNWMETGSYVWTITRPDSSKIFAVVEGHRIEGGYFDGYGWSNGSGIDVRPAFYLEPNTAYASGTGTKSDPFRIN